MTKAAFFDIDGVLTRGFVIHDFWIYLAEKGEVEKEALAELEDIRKKYFKGSMTYEDFVRKAVKSAAMSLKGKRHSKIKEEMRRFLEKRSIDIFPYSKPLVKMLKEKNFRIIAISGSNIDFIDNYRKILGFDEVYGTELEVADGVYTGNIKTSMGLKEVKSATIGRLIDGNKKTIGFGDTEQDAAILEKVTIPVALNPNSELREIASKRRWHILTEKDNVVEEVRKLI